MGKNILYGSKWYTEEEVFRNKKIDSPPLLVTRNYCNKEYILKYQRFNKNKECEIKYIDNKKDFINKFFEYRSKPVYDLFTKKINKGKVLFKLKMDKEKYLIESNKIIRKYEIIKNGLTNYDKDKGCTRKHIEDYMNNNEFTINDLCIVKYKIIKKFKSEVKTEVKTAQVYFFDEDNENNHNSYIVFKENSESELRKKIDLYNQFIIINTEIYNVMEKLVTKKAIFSNRNFIDYMYDFLVQQDYARLNQAFKIIKKTINESNNEESLLKFLAFYFKIKDNHNRVIFSSQKFYNQFIKYINNETELDNDDYINYIIETLTEFKIVRKVEAKKNIQNEDYGKYVNTYIAFDNHNVKKIPNKESVVTKETAIAEILSNFSNVDLNKEINEVCQKFKFDVLCESLKNSLSNNNKDTKLFGVLKEHYVFCFGKTNDLFLSYKEKFYFKIIYTYLKGRVNKIIINKKYNYNDYNKFFNEEKYYVEKINEMILQQILEHLLYHGKTTFLDQTDVNTLDFQKFHAEESLYADIIIAINETNIKLNNFTKNKNDEVIDFFGDGFQNNQFEYKKIDDDTHTMLTMMNFLDSVKIKKTYQDRFTNNFKSMIDSVYLLRSQIVHFSRKTTSNYTNVDFEKNLKNYLNTIKISDDVKCKNLNMNIIFKDKKELIEKANLIKIDDVNSSKLMPSFSKLMPYLKTMFYEYNKESCFINDERTYPIIFNSYVYFHKKLYKKFICSSEFTAFLVKNEISKKRIDAQRKDTSVGNNNLRKLNNFLIKEYFRIIEKYFGNTDKLYNFNSLKYNYQEFSDEIQRNSCISFDKSYTIYSEEINFKINNSFEENIAFISLFCSNDMLSNMRNRFINASIWNSNFPDNNKNYDNIISLIDQTLSARNDKFNYSNMLGNNLEFIIESLGFEGNKIYSDIDSGKVSFDEDNNKFHFHPTEFCDAEKKDIENYKVYYEGLNEKIDKKSGLKSNIDARNNYVELIKDNFNDEKYKDVCYQITKDGYKKTIFRRSAYINTMSYFMNDYTIDIINEPQNTYNEFHNIGEHINKINQSITHLNKSVKNLDKKFKKDYASKIVNDEIKLLDYKNYEEFKEDFELVEKYKYYVNYIDLQHIKEVEIFLLKLNYKLSKSIVRLERDLHYIISGLNKMNLINIKGYSLIYSRPLPTKLGENNSYYVLSLVDQEKVYKILEFLGVNYVDELKKERKNNIRNYISHFYLTREFGNQEQNIMNIIKRVDDITSYRTKYRNSVVNSVFEIMKNNVDIDYNRMKSGFDFDNGMEHYDKIVGEKSITILELKTKKHMKELYKRILFGINNI